MMQLSKETETEVLGVYHAYWNAYLNGDMETFASYMDDQVTIYGTAVGEIFFNRKDAVKFYSDTAHEMTGKTEFRNRQISLQTVGNAIAIYEQSDLYILIETEWTFYGHARISGVLEKKADGWKLVHQHGSFPDGRTEEGQQLASEKIKEENVQLREAVYRRTVDLENKTRELEIESSLEKIRTVAMSMRKPDDMLEVCRIISEQLEMLGVKEIRNVQTAIFYQDKGVYINYEYYRLHKQSLITEVDYLTHPIQEKFANAMISGKGEMVIEKLTGKEVIDWVEYQATTPQFVDTHLYRVSSLNYYWYSLGPIALGMSTYAPLTDEEMALFKRFRNVFDLAYRRYLDIEQAEALAREAQIEVSLERVRSRSMAMQRSEELVEASNVLFSELHKLGIEAIRTGVGTADSKNETVVVWSSQLVENNEIKILGVVPKNAHPFFEGYFAAWQTKEPWFTYTMDGNELIAYYKKMSALLSYPEKTEFNPTESFNVFFFPEGSLNVITERTLSEAECKLIQRFANVFGQIYRRFLDLKLAEAQAREAQIELALERVRARTMAMQRSDELSETAHVLFQQFTALGETPIQITIGIVHEEEGYIEFRVTDWEGGGLQVNRGFNASIDEPSLVQKMFMGWKGQQKSLVVDLSGKELEAWVTYRNAISGVKVSSADTAGRRVITCAFFSRGHISFSSPEPRSKETTYLLERFAGVFDQTYTRFLDLQRSEAQAKEAQIEAALERVRSKTMAMQKSEELKEVIQVVFEQFLQLNIHIEHTGFVMDYKERDDYDIWVADPLGVPSQLTIPYFDSIYYNRFNEAKEKGEDFFATLLTFEQKNTFYQTLFEFIPGLPEEAKTFYFNCPGLAASTVLLENIGLYIENFSATPYTDEENATLMRFGKVFQQTYTRFLDLKKAEEQSRESQIEAALEKVRSRTMAMQKSAELTEAANLLFQQVQALGMPAWSAGYTLWDDDKKAITLWMSSEGVIQSPFKAPLTEDPSFIHFLEGHHRGESLHVEEVGGEALAAHYAYMRTLPGVGEVLDNIIAAGFQLPTYQIFHAAYFSHGFLLFITYEPVPIAHDIFKRFANVFDQTYTRFLDLQKSEAQTREAQIETGLERIRSRTMAMQSCDELSETAAVVLQELVKLGISPNRLYIAIIDSTNTDVHFYLTNEDGSKDCSVYTSQIDKNITVRKIYDGWAAHHSSITLLLQGDELANYMQYLREEVGVPYKSTTIPQRRVQTISYFSQGYIGIVSQDDQSEETTKLLERFAAVFNLTYTRFNDLKQAEKLAHQANLDLLRLKEEKAKTEIALAELKAAQAQLIQAEKMASLGELTAGIAHEIQNPLNFVNNFSDVNTELIEEMKQELQSGNTDEAIAIANDIADNEQKINHHGKRADAIVKGMLQHSRSSSGVKELTDINALADEYLRLAYHGLRAKDKSFNATIKTDFDASIGMINIIPQDIGRVMLNLITNAFYAVSTPISPDSSAPWPPEGGKKYEPSVSIVTKLIKSPLGDLGAKRSNGDTGSGLIEISVSDNGPGIPASALDKIFQPFFTTKPTGQGTGLGLSLSYDIIKAHGGELNVETKEGEGTTFTIQLPLQS